MKAAEQKAQKFSELNYEVVSVSVSVSVAASVSLLLQCVSFSLVLSLLLSSRSVCFSLLSIDCLTSDSLWNLSAVVSLHA